MTLSIITSVYRSEAHLTAFLKRAIEVHEQLRAANIAFEHLLILNDPTQEELRILESCKEHFQIHTVERESIYASWNRGIRASKGENITFWNVDDTRTSSALIAGVSALSGGEQAVYFPFIYKRYIPLFGLHILVKIKKVQPNEFDAKRFETEMHAGPHFMVRRDVFDSVGLFDETFKIAGDFEWWSRFARSGGAAKKIDTVSGVFTNNGKTLSGSKNSLQQVENKRVYDQAT